MKKILKIIGYLFIGISVFMMGYLGAHTVDVIYDSFKVLREHQEQIDKMKNQYDFEIYLQTKNNKRLYSKLNKIKNDLSDSKQVVYNLMGEVTVVKHNQVNIDKKVKMNKNLLKKQINKIENDVIEPKPTYEEMKSSTVYIVQQKEDSHGGSVGTGVIVKQDFCETYILTNKHVCNEKNKGECFVEIYKHGNFLKVPLTFVKQEKSDYDLALWKTSEFLPNKTEIKGLKEAFPQDKVYSVGNYLGFRYIYTEGTFAGYRGNYIMLNMPCVYGCSGSAVFNKDGYLIGLVFAGNRIDYFQVDASKVLLVPYEIIKRFLEDI